MPEYSAPSPASSPSRTALDPRARHALWLVALALLIPQLIGSAFNIWYNLTHIEPLLSPAQHAIFARTILLYNIAVYPPLTALCFFVVFALRRPLQQVLSGQHVAEAELQKARCRTINLPWITQLICALGWLGCVPVFLAALKSSPGFFDPRLLWHLPVSFFISACIATTQAFFAIELISQRLLFPAFFTTACPAKTSGIRALTLRGRGLMWAISGGICPILSLLLLILAPHNSNTNTAWFALSVAGISIAFDIVTVLLLGRLVTEPVDELRRAAQAVTQGEREVCVSILRADEFGPLIEDFNHMVIVLREKEELLQAAQDEILARLANAAELRDHDTGDHTVRVGKLAANLSRELGLEANRVETILRAAPLHDVGKIGIPDHILLKPGKLSDEEFAVMQSHTTIGGRLLDKGNSEIMGMAQIIALCHHERWDGSGYPRGLCKDEIPIEGCIVSVVDVFDALTHARPYKKAWSLDEALQEIEKLSGTHFCPDVTRAFLRLPR